MVLIATALVGIVGEGTALAAEPPIWPPNAEINVSNVTGTSATLSWPAAAGATGYRIYDDESGALLGDTLSPTPSITLSSLSASTGYRVRVEAYAVDGAGEAETTDALVLGPRNNLPMVGTPTGDPFCDNPGPGAVNYAVLCPHSVNIADLDGDGSNDVVVALAGSNDVAVLRGNGDGTFQAGEPYSVGADASSPNPKNVAVADLDNDDTLDLVTANQATGDLSVLSSFGVVPSGFELKNTLVTAFGTHDVVVGDWNNDGKLDLASSGWGEDSPLGEFPEREDIAIWMGATTGNGDFTFSGPAFADPISSG
ncbi:MAG: FG-GAP-like repeat-containing protein, partial [Acidimicrobiia bacterium]|nr:FG-GAP-like repeat-containing protein [Acidimicrobiia bacterium]